MDTIYVKKIIADLVIESIVGLVEKVVDVIVHNIVEQTVEEEEDERHHLQDLCPVDRSEDAVGRDVSRLKNIKSKETGEESSDDIAFLPSRK